MQSESYLHVVVRHQITWFMRLRTLGAGIEGFEMVSACPTCI